MAREDYEKIKVVHGAGTPLGAYVIDKNRIQFSVFAQNVKELNLHLFFNGDDGSEFVITMDEQYCTGNIFSVIIAIPDSSQCVYIYEENGKYFLDPYAKQLIGRENWGTCNEQTDGIPKVKCKAVEHFRLKEEVKKRKLYKISDLFIYRLHVRGFTMDASSKTTAKGTFLGILEKADYLKKLGVNAVELMPCYEFEDEFRDYNGVPSGISSSITMPVMQQTAEEVTWKTNYWGYTENSNYFAPKISYCWDTKNPCKEFGNFVREMHENEIEVYMEIYFAYNTNQHLIVDCLNFWHREYGVDGFRLNKEWIPEKLIATDPMLGQVKLFTSEWNLSSLYPDEKYPDEKRLADYNDSFMISARRFLKGDEEQVHTFAEMFKENSSHKGRINYIANTNSMTLMDMVSYDIKHNELNGENGRDGTNYNYSWNCGWEGKTRRKSVMELRRKQIKNALIMLFFSQGTPLLLAGDEFGNSQNGNNNPYCIDSPVSWVNWKELKRNNWMLEFVKKLVSFRKQHKILHRDDQLRTMDYISCGCPDLSFHGTMAWYPDYSNYCRELGILLCGKYAKISRTECDKDIYIAFNCYWESREFSLPNTLKRHAWEVFIDTSKELEDTGGIVTKKTYLLKPRTVVVFVEAEEPEPPKDFV